MSILRRHADFSFFGFVLIQLHQGLLSSSPNVDVNATAVELEVSLKMFCLAALPLWKCYKGVCDNQSRDEHDLDDNDDDDEWQWQYIL